MVTRILILLLLLLLPRPILAQDSLRLIIPQMRPIVGEMIPVTIRGEYTGWIALEQMTVPDSPAYDWMQLQPDNWRDERVDGKQRRIFERRIAVFPRRPGNLVLGPVTHHLTKAEGAARTERPVQAPAISLTVAPYPAPGLPLAARNLKVSDELSGDPARIRDDQTIQRRITITAEGTMAHLLPPRPDLREKWLISFTAPEKRETRLTANGPLAFVQWEWSLRPITGEQGTLPPMRFSWFDLAKRELRGAITQPIIFGYGRVGSGVAGATAGPGWLLPGLLALGAVAALALLVPGQGPKARGALMLALRRRLPNPHRAALRRAAADGDLMALRRAAGDYARHAQSLGRPVDPAALARLDGALFAPAGGEALDRARLLRDLLRPRPGGFPGQTDA